MLLILDLLHRYGSTVIIDSTYKFCKYNISLFTLAVRTNTIFLPVGYAFLECETKHNFNIVLQQIKDWNPDWNPILFVMDYSQSEI